MADPEPRQIEWGSAQFEDGTLTVDLSGESSKEWNARFATVLSLLDPRHREWGEVKLRKNRIRIIDVHQGTESELRHFLESIVLQANSDIEPDEASEASGAAAEDEPESDLDEQMTATFRSFGSD